MASQMFNIAKNGVMDGTIDLDTDTLIAVLCMTNTTADTEIDVDTVSALADLDEFDGSGFTWGWGNTGRKALASRSVTVDDANDRAKFDAADITWASLGAGTRSAAGVLIIKKGAADDTDAIPICWNEFSTPIVANGGPLVATFDALGLLHLT